MTRAEKVLLFLLILALLALIGLSAFIITHFLVEQDCYTQECISASFKLLKTIDFTANPCTNFQKFVCGNYIPIYDEKKTDLITSPLTKEDSGPLAMVKKFYQACTNSTIIEEDSENTLSTLISQIGGWPLLMGSKWVENDFNWQRFMVEVRPWGIRNDWLLSFDYYQDEDETNLLLIKPPQVKSTPYQFKTEYYVDILNQLVDKLESEEFTENELMKMINFEDNLAQITERVQNDLLQETTYVNVTVAKLNEIWPENVLVEVLNSLARGYAVFTNSTTVVLASENYLYELHKLLMRTGKRTQANYFMWRVIENYLPFSSDDIRKTYTKYFKLGSREDHCHAETIRRFYSIIKSEDVGKYKNAKTLPMLERIADLTYQSYKKDNDANIEVVVQGPEGENSGVTDVSFTSDKIIKMINQVQFRIDNEFYRCLHKKSDSCVKENYFEELKVLEPSFDRTFNTVYLPYSMVYSDSFKWNQPNYINFARIGLTIGTKILEAEAEETNSSITNFGANLAYDGYVKWLQTNGKEPKLPAFNFTVKQLFWIHSSSLSCSSENDFNKFDVANSQYFKEDFQCQ